MYHPILVEYCKRSGYRYDLCPYLKEEVRLSLRNSHHIMSLTWRHLRDLGFPGSQDVYEFGWEFSLDTRRLKRLFEEIVSFEGFDHKKLEDYL